MSSQPKEQLGLGTRHSLFQDDGCRLSTAWRFACFHFHPRTVEPLEAAMKKVPDNIHARRNFLALSAGAAGLVRCPNAWLFAQTATGAAGSATAMAPQPPATGASATRPRPDPLKPELVKEFVVAAHG